MGGGHRSVAVALQEVLDADERTSDTAIFPGRQSSKLSFGGLHTWMYLNLSLRLPRAWGLYFRLSRGPAVDCVERLVGRIGVFRGLANRISSFDPDVIVSTSRLTNPHAARFKKSFPERATCCVVTDLVDGHPSWIRPGIDSYLLPQPGHHLESRVPIGARHYLHGLPLRRAFCALSPADRCREVLIMVPILSATLVEILKHIEEVWPDVRFVVTRSISSMTRRNLPTSYVESVESASEIAESMRRAALVICKAGSVSLSECAAAEVLAAIITYTPGQESSNVDWAIKRSVAVYTPTLRAFQRQLHLVDDKFEMRAGPQSSSIGAGFRGASRLAADLILELGRAR